MDAVALGYLGAGIGAGLAIVGGGVGIGILANGAMHGMARQPQSAGTIQTGTRSRSRPAGGVER